MSDAGRESEPAAGQGPRTLELAAGPGSRAELGAVGDESVIVRAGLAAGVAGEVARLPVRGSKPVSRSPINDGRFGPCSPPDGDDSSPERRVARSLRSDGRAGCHGRLERNVENLDNLDIPAGYTYLGQFIAHDITFDPTSTLQRQNTRIH